MKKILILILGSIVTTGAFAQFTFRFEQTLNAHMFSFIAPTGLYAQQNVLDPATGNPIRNTGVPQATLTNGVYSGILSRGFLFPTRDDNTGYYTPFNYSFFTTEVKPIGDPRQIQNAPGTTTPGWPSVQPNQVYGSWTDYNSMKFSMIYTRGIFQALVGFDGTRLMTRMFARDLSFINLFDSFRIVEYFFRVNHDLVTLWFGDVVFPTKVDVYNDFSDWNLFMRVDWLGVSVPWRAFTVPEPETEWVFRSRPQGLFREVVAGTNILDSVDVGYFITSLKMLNHFYKIPINIDIGVDVNPLYQFAINNTGFGNRTDISGQSRFAGGVRVSGERIGGHLNFDLTYKMRGGDGSRDDSWSEDTVGGGVQPDGTGRMTHVLGLALGLPSYVSGLGMSIGYTALFVTYEDLLVGPHSPSPPPESYTITRKGPLFNGFDMRLRYTAAPDWRFTLSNNISFARNSEPFYDENFGIITGERANIFHSNLTIPRYVSQSWLAVFNALAIRYTVSPLITANLEILNRLAKITENNSDDLRGSLYLSGWGSSERVKMILTTSAYARFNLTGAARGIFLEAGLSMLYENNSTKFSNYPDGFPSDYVTDTSWSGGGVGFAIPLRLVINW